MTKQYIIRCWHCRAEFNAFEATFCFHQDPSKICPFCLNCSCHAPQDYKDKIISESPDELLAEKKNYSEKTELKLGEILLKAGKISEENLELAMEKQAVLKLALEPVANMLKYYGGSIPEQCRNSVLCLEKELIVCLWTSIIEMVNKKLPWWLQRNALISIGKSIIPFLKNIIETGNNKERDVAIATLGEMGKPPVVPILEGLLQSNDAKLREIVVQALGKAKKKRR